MSSLVKLFDIIELIDRTTLQLTSGERPFFKNISIKIGTFSDTELGFYKSISYLYVLFFEASSKSLDFIEKKFPGFQISPSEKILYHRKTVQAFRTFLQHNLDRDDGHDSSIITFCQDWFNNIIRKNFPVSRKDWEKSIEHLLNSTNEYLSLIHLILTRIQKHEHKDLILRDWDRKVKRNHSIYEFEKIFNRVKSNFGLTSLDSLTYCKKNHSEWLKKIDELNDEYDFEYEAQRIIELSITINPIIPLTGNDIIKELQLQPGPKIKILLDEARRFYYQNPCDTQTLLNHLKTL